MEAITDALRILSSQLDTFIYMVIRIVYNVIEFVANISIFGADQISDFSQKIYGVMGLFMLFKVSFSLLNYIVDPDSFSDKGKGAGSIVKNIIIVLILIILAPFAFDLMTDAQNVILNDHILERFIFGTSDIGNDKEIEFKINDYCINSAKIKGSGNFVSLSIFSTFYQPNFSKTKTHGGSQYEDENDMVNNFLDSEYNYCDPGEDDITVNNYLRADLYTRQNGTGDMDEYDIDYMIIWSTITGAVCALLFLNIGLEIAKRAVKLGFLQLIAPIPIISYVDPKSGKDGMFKKWLKQLGSTWASLFIRLGAVYFAVYLIGLVLNSMYDITADQGFFMRQFIKLFFIFGCLMFAKELPKLLENLIPGLNMGGSFTLSPLKNIRENMVGGKAMLGVTSAGLGLAGGALSNWYAAHQRNSAAEKLVDKSRYQDANGNWRGATPERKAAFKAAYKRKLQENGYMGARSITNSVIAGGSSAGFRSFWNTSKDGKILSGTERGITSSSKARNLRRDSGYGLKDRVKDKATDVAGVRASSGTTSLLKNKINENNFKIENAKRDEAAATYAMQEMAMTDQGRKYREFMIAFEELSRNVNKNTHGVDVEYKFNTYNDYQTAASARGLTNTEMLTQEEFDNYQAAIRRRDIADSTAHQLQFENQNIEKQQNLYKGSGK